MQSFCFLSPCLLPSVQLISKGYIFQTSSPHFRSYLSPVVPGQPRATPACKDTSLKGNSLCRGQSIRAFGPKLRPSTQMGGQQFGGLSALKAAAPLVRVRAGSQLEQGFLARVVLKVLPQACKYMFPSDSKGAGCCADVH